MYRMNNMLIVFNVWWAMASYCEIDWKKIVIDLWSSESFSPTNDFLLNLAKEQKWKTVKDWNEEQIDEKKKVNNVNLQNKFYIDQLIISHPHKDHLSDFENFEKYFYPMLITTPNDRVWMLDVDKINWNIVKWKEKLDEKVEYFKKNIEETGRKPPLQSCSDKLQLFYISPKINEEKLPINDYVNNLSLVCLVQISSNYILLPWDIMQSWSDYMLLKTSDVKNISTKGTITKFYNMVEKVNILIAPHHWLKSAYNSNLIDCMEKLELVIIPEKPFSEWDDREVDKRYHDKPKWKCVIMQNNDDNEFKWIKTSNGHIVITEKYVKLFNSYDDFKKWSNPPKIIL